MTCKRGFDQVMKDIRYLNKGYVELLSFENRQHSHTKVNPGPDLRHEQDRELFELKQQTFAIHGGQPELKLHKSCALRMSHGRRGLSRRAPMNFSRPCRFATTLILHGFLRRQR